MNYVGHYLLVAALFAVIDSVWIGIVANKFYKKQMGGLLRDKPDFVPAVVFYLIYVLGMVVLALEPALATDSLAEAFGFGAMVGASAYAAYDLTNASTLKNWSKAVTIVDLIWGTMVTMLSTVIAYLILS